MGTQQGSQPQNFLPISGFPGHRDKGIKQGLVLSLENLGLNTVPKVTERKLELSPHLSKPCTCAMREILLFWGL